MSAAAVQFQFDSISGCYTILS